MPDSASPFTRKSDPSRPDLPRAGGREAGDIRQLPCAARASPARFAAPRFPRYAAPIVCASRVVATSEITAKPRRRGSPPSPGSMARLGGSASHRKSHRRQERVQPWPAMEYSAQVSEVVSRVPCRSRHAQAFGTEINTDRTGFTHQQQHKGQHSRGNERKKWKWKLEGGEYVIRTTHRTTLLPLSRRQLCHAAQP
jgi:hypothetical protein